MAVRPLEPGAVLAGYRLGARIGEGGMGVVWEAEQLALRRQAAIKVIRPELAVDPEFRRRFEEEARAAAAIQHPNVITVFDAGEADGWLFLAMALVRGPTLREVLDREGRLAPPRAAAVVGQLAEGLEAAHRAGLVHRDVKPANVLLDDDGARAVLTDFGVAKARDASVLTRTGALVGTLDYLAPEQVQGGPVDPRTDVYALGCLLYEVLTGSVPFARETAPARMWAHVHEPPPSPSATPGVPAAFDAVVATALAKAPDDRYPSARALGAAVAVAREQADATPSAIGDTLAPAATTRVRPLGPTPRSSPAAGAPRRRHATSLLVGGAVALLAVGGAVALLVGRSSGDQSPTTVTRTASEPGTTTKAKSAGSAGKPSGREDLVPYRTDAYRALRPAGWITVADQEDHGVYDESKWRNPSDSRTSVLIDHTPGVSLSAADAAAPVQAQVRKDRGYREISSKQVTLAGVPALRWEFEEQGDRRVDYFLTGCGSGYAVLGSTSRREFPGYEPLFRAMAESIAGGIAACGDRRSPSDAVK